MHDGPFLGLQGVHHAQIIGFGPDSRAKVMIPALGETLLLAQSLVPIPAAAVGRLAAVTMMDDQPLILGLLQPLMPEVEADGEALILEARQEMTLRCGAASITMTADGRVTIRAPRSSAGRKGRTVCRGPLSS